MEHKYITFVGSGLADVADKMQELIRTFGPLDPAREYLYALGTGSPLLLTATGEQMRREVNTYFDMALQYNVPVYFQADDMVGLGFEHMRDDQDKYFEHPEMCEWLNFPSEGDAHGRQARFWFNWGAWICTPGVVCFNSPAFLAYRQRQLDEILPTFRQRYAELVAMGKEHLFAGIALGWETSISDYRDFHQFDEKIPLICGITGEKMQPHEYTRVGYHALHNLGYTEEKLQQEAAARGISYDELWVSLLADVQQAYTAGLCRAFFEVGLPREKIYSHIVAFDSQQDEDILSTVHPRIRTAVNPYCTPGFTMSPETCPYDTGRLLRKIQQVDPAQRHFANAEGYAAGLKTSVEDTLRYFDDLFGNGCLQVTVFGYGDPSDGFFAVPRDVNDPFNQAVLQYLNR